MITFQYRSKSKLFPQVQCLQCNDLETEESRQELYIVVTSKTRQIKYVGMSSNYWSNRPTRRHNSTYHKYLNKYPDGYTILRFKCENAGLLERAGLDLVKDKNVWNRSWDNGFDLTEESKGVIEMLCLTYNLKINVTSKKA